MPVFLDTYGPALDRIWGFWPTVIQLNRREAAIRLRKPSITDDDMAGLLQEWHRRGVSCAVVTDGPNPVSIIYRGRRYRAIPPQINRSTRSARATRFWPAWLRLVNRLEPEALVRHAIGCAIANALVWDAGAIEPAIGGAMEQTGCVEPAAGGGSLTNWLLAAGRVLRLLFGPQNLDQFPQFTQEEAHLFAIGPCLFGSLLFTGRIASWCSSARRRLANRGRRLPRLGRRVPLPGPGRVFWLPLVI